MEVICHRCKHQWNYSGEKLDIKNNYPKYISCPNCRTSVKIIQMKGGAKNERI